MKKRRALVVEDSSFAAEAVAAALSGLEELDLQVTATAEEALRKLDSGDYSALITDLRLPGIDGFTLIQQLRGQARYAKIPIIVISAEPDPGIPARVFALGANAYFAKPYSPAAVRRKLEELLNAM